MSSNCPPQLQLSLHPNTTSFKRSFEQFGFDLASPVEVSGSSSNDRNDRNKRARSESSFSDRTDSTASSQSSTLTSGSSSSSSLSSNEDEPSLTGVLSENPLGPPRLPTPVIQDIEMPDYPSAERNSLDSLSSQVQAGHNYRLSLRRFNAFDSQDTILRQSRQSSPAISRIPTPPPVLPPLSISGDRPRLSITASAFLHTPPRPSTPLTEVVFGDINSSRTTVQSPPVDDSEMIQGFRARLSGALERIIPQSPLVPGLELEEEEQPQIHVHNQGLEQSTELSQEPPMLPPIPSVSSSADMDHFNIEDLLTNERSVHPLSNEPVSSISPTLDAPSLPSPILQDLHPWMEVRSTANDFIHAPSSHHGRSYPSNIGSTSGSIQVSSRLQASEDETARMLRRGSRTQEQAERFSMLPQSHGLWQRPPLDLRSISNYNSAQNVAHTPYSTTSSAPDSSRTGRMYTLRCRPRLGSSTSLVTENSFEARRRADHDHVIRDPYTSTRERNDEMDVESLNENRSESGERSRRPSSAQHLERPHAPYVLQLPPLPTPSLDVAPDTPREDGRYHFEYDTRPLSQPSGMWYMSPYLQSALEVRRPLLPGFTSSNFVPSNSFLSPLHQSPPGPPPPPPLHTNWSSPLTREPPPFLPPPDLGWAFEAEGHDRDIEMRPTPQIRAMHEQSYPPFPESRTSSSAHNYLQPRSQVLRVENNSTQALRSDHAATRVSHVPQPYQPARAVMDVSLPPNFRQITSNIQRTLQTVSAMEERQRQHQDVSLEIQRSQNMGHEQQTASESEDEDEGSSPSTTTGPVNPLAIHPDNFIPGRYRDPNPIPLPDDPIYHFRHSVIEESGRRQSTYPYALDPTSFAPGPFRNTINESLHHRTNHPAPPTIPPLPFEESGPASHPRLAESLDLPSRSQEPASRDSQPPLGHREDRRGLGSLLNGRSRHNLEHQLPPSSLPFARTSFVGNSNNSSTERQSALHRFMIEHSMESSRVFRPPSLGSPAVGPTNPNRPHAPVSPIDPVRHDNINITRQFQLLDQYNQNESERRRRNTIRTEVTAAEATQPNPTPRPGGTPRRYGNTDPETHQPTWRARNRGRFRSASEFLSASRMRSGNVGDFVHDDDFDDSYENLLNLAATLGDVKSKSTPQDTLEKLEKGTFKEWKAADGDKRCPICLDDYTDRDVLLKLNNCAHWFHQGCVKQWLHTANTCPVCRNCVHEEALPPSPTTSRFPALRFFRRSGGQPPSPSYGDSSPAGRSGNGSGGVQGPWTPRTRRRPFD